MKQQFIQGTTDDPGNNEYLGLFSPLYASGSFETNLWQTTEANASQVCPSAGVIKNLYVKIDVAPGAGATRTFKVYKNGLATSLVVAFGASNTALVDRTNVVSVVAGDVLSLESTLTGSPAIISQFLFSVEFEGSTAKENFLSAGGIDTLNSVTTEYNALHSFGLWGAATETDSVTLVPHACTLNAMYVKLTAAPGTGKQYVFQLRKNGVDISGASVTIAGTNTTGNVTGLSTALVAGDYLTISSAASGIPTTPVPTIGVSFISTNDGESMLCGCAPISLGVSAFYMRLPGTAKHAAGTETSLSVVGAESWLAKNFRVLLFTSPGTSKSRTFTLRKDAGDTILSITISGSNTTGTDGDTVYLTISAQLAVYQAGSTSLTNGSDAAWSLTQFIDPTPQYSHLEHTTYPEIQDIRKERRIPFLFELIKFPYFSTGTTYQQTLSETVTLTDDILKISNKILTETVTFTDTLVRLINRAFSETITYTDTLLKSIFKTLDLETVTYTDTLIKAGQKVASETVTFTDTLNFVTQRIFSETITYTDTLINQTLKILNETIAYTDTLVTSLVRVITLEEIITYTDTFLKTAQKVLIETVTHTDTIEKVILKVFNETVTHTDILVKVSQRIFTETVAYTDTLVNITGKIFSETVTYTDTLIRSALKTLTETITLTDILSFVTAKVLSETITFTDTIVRVSQKIFTETITYTDTLLKQPVKILEESITYTDILTKQIIIDFAEVVTYTDDLTAQKISGAAKNYYTGGMANIKRMLRGFGF